MNLTIQSCRNENLTTILPEASADAIIVLQADIANAVIGHL